MLQCHCVGRRGNDAPSPGHTNAWIARPRVHISGYTPAPLGSRSMSGFSHICPDCQTLRPAGTAFPGGAADPATDGENDLARAVVETPGDTVNNRFAPDPAIGACFRQNGA